MKTAAHILALAFSLSAFGANRVFVSGNGVDIGTCPINAPCRSFSYALSQTGAPAEVIALDTAGYGTVTIPFSATLTAAPGATAFVAAASGTAIDVSTLQSDVVTLRGLALTSNGAGTGISFDAGLLNVERCVINGFADYGIYFIASGVNTNPRLQIVETTLRYNGWGVLAVHFGPGSPGGGLPPGAAYVTVAGSSFVGNSAGGIEGQDNARIAISGSVFTGNFYGIFAEAGSDTAIAEIAVDRCEFSTNYWTVVAGQGGQNLRGIIRLANSSVTGNLNGLTTFGGTDGEILSRVSNGVYTNTVEGNNTDGAFTGTYSAK
jgi:hypothetical protein